MKKSFLPNLLDVYVYLPLLTLVIGIYVIFFAEDKFRYECQDPTFWDAPQCNPPICLASGVCTSDLVDLTGSYTNRYTIADIEEPEISITDNTCNCNNDNIVIDSDSLDKINNIFEEINTNE